MKPLFALSFATLLPVALGVETSAPPAADPIVAMGAYVPTDDMQGSEAFYRALFDRAPVIELADFVAFAVAGGWFAIVSRDRYAPGTEPGTGAVPYLQATDLGVLQARVAATGRTEPEIIQEPGIRLLKVTDPNGQLIEFFALTGQ